MRMIQLLDMSWASSLLTLLYHPLHPTKPPIQYITFFLWIHKLSIPLSYSP